MSDRRIARDPLDPFELERFVRAQDGIYDQALAELRNGRKRSHWIWFVFPQISGLGQSETSRRFAIRTLDEARAYLTHPILGRRLLECTEAVLALENRSASEIFGYPDDLKFHSSMTLFGFAASRDSIFQRAIEKYYRGEPDRGTVALLGTVAERGHHPGRQAAHAEIRRAARQRKDGTRAAPGAADPKRASPRIGTHGGLGLPHRELQNDGRQVGGARRPRRGGACRKGEHSARNGSARSTPPGNPRDAGPGG